MQITSKPFKQLNECHFKAWARLQHGGREYDSPFFSPGYTSAVASVRDDIWVGIMQHADRIVGLFPFQRGPRGIAVPVGGDISQFHGVLVEPNVEWDAANLLAACDIKSWAFDHLPVSQTPLLVHHHCIGESPYIDLTHGFDAYTTEKRQSGKAIEQALRKTRKLEREVGALRFVLHDTSDKVFQDFLQWKSEQHRRTNVVDAFQFEWLRQLLDRIRLQQTDDFSGVMSALYAGKHLVAVHYGMKSKTVAHSWYPAYDVAFARHSPGITLLLKLAEALADEGIQRIDFAARQQIYKTLMNGAIPVAKGVADRSRLKACVRRNADVLRERIKETPLATPIRVPVRMLRQVGRWWAEQ